MDTKKKKIILLGVAHPFRGGLASYNERLAEELLIQGYEVELSTFTLQYPNFLFPGKTQYSESPKPNNLNIIEEVNSVNPFNWIKVGNRIKNAKPDYLIFKFWLPFMGPCFGTIARIAKKNKFSKIICIIDNIVPHEKRIGDRFLANYFVKSMDGFIAMSKEVLKDLRTFDTSKPQFFSPHPIFDNFGTAISKNEALDALKLDKSYKYIMFFGFIRDYKGLDMLIEAYSDSRFRGLNTKLIVAGEFYSDSQKYFDQIKQLGLENEIIMHNHFIPNEEVKNYFCACDIVAQPYRTATQSGVTQIGYHFEKPMLVTNVGGLAEIIPNKKVGYVVEPKPSEISDALVDFFENKKEGEMITGVIDEKKKYAWSKMVDSIEEVTSEIQK